MILKVIVGGVAVFLAVWAWKIHIYLKRQKRKERDEAPFHRWADEVHQRPGQKEKLRQAKEEDISVHFESEKKCFARKKSGVVWECASAARSRPIIYLVSTFTSWP